jgi:hypothetical protein
MLEFLSKNPVLGFVSGVSSPYITFLESFQEGIRFFGFAVGMIIAILTVYAKILEIRKRKRDLDDKK